MAKKKHVRTMKNDELIQHLFHPKVVEHLRQSMRGIEAGGGP